MYCNCSYRFVVLYLIFTVQNLLILYLFLLSCSQTRFFACTQTPFSRCALTHDASSLSVTLRSHSLRFGRVVPTLHESVNAATGFELAAPTTRSVYVTLSVRAKVRRFCSRAAAQVFRGSYLLVLADRNSISSAIFLITHVYVFF